MSDIAALTNEGFTLLGATGGPLILLLLIVGVVVGVIQATTQINDPSIAFLPRMLVAIIAFYTMGGWAMERCAQYLASALARMAAGA